MMPPLERSWHEARYIVRSWLRRGARGPIGIAIATLAFALGVAIAVLQVSDDVLWKPLRSTPSASLVNVQLVDRDARHHTTYAAVATPYHLFAAWRRAPIGFAALGAFMGTRSTMTGSGPAEFVPTIRVSTDLWKALDAAPLAGRLPQAQEDERVVVLSALFWRRHFGGDSSALGKSITLDGAAYRVIGIMPPTFQVPLSLDEASRGTGAVWVPMAALLPDTSTAGAGSAMVNVIGRLRTNVDPRSLEARLDAVTANDPSVVQQLKAFAADSAHTPRFAQVISVHDVEVGDTWRVLALLLTSVAVALLIACTNAGHVLLIRTISRRRELATRLALGATRARVARQIFFESLMLAIVGTVLGCVLGALAAPALLIRVAPSMSSTSASAFEGRSAALAIGLVIFAAICTWIAPASWTVRSLSGAALRDGTSQAGSRRRRVTDFIVMLQVASALLLIAGATLLAKTLLRLTTADRGYEINHVWTTTVDLPKDRFTSPALQRTFAEQVVSQLRSRPGIDAAAASTGAPISGGVSTFAASDAAASTDPHAATRVAVWAVTSDYLGVWGIPEIRGRTLAQSPSDAILIDKAAAQRFFPATDPIGHRLWWARGAQSGTVVGIVGDVSELYFDTKSAANYRAHPLHIYMPFAAGPRSHAVLLFRARGDSIHIAQAVRAAVDQVAPDVPLDDVVPVRSEIMSEFAAEQLTVTITSVLGVLCLLIAAAGIYAVISYNVTTRTHEIGVRLALGARVGDVTRLVMANSATPVALGALVGVASALLLAQAFHALLFEVSPRDLVGVGTGVLVVFCATLAAAAMPARRIRSISPADALRGGSL